MKARALRGSGWTIAGYGASQVIRLGSSLVLTRLLFPEAYGLMALAQVFLAGLQMLSDLGLRPAIIQSSRGFDPTFLNTAWTLQVIRGFVLAALACAAAYPLAAFYNEPQLFAVLCVLSATTAISGFDSTGFSTANKRLALGRVTSIGLWAQIISVTVMIGWAALHPTVWALVAGGIAGAIARLVLGFRFLPTHRHKFEWHGPSARELFSFGFWIFVASVMSYAAHNGDRLVLGEFLGMAGLGLYSLALNLAMLPKVIFQRLGDQVLMAVYAEQKNADRPVLRQHIAKARLMIGTLLVPPACLLIVFGQEIIDLLYDERYADAGWMLQVLATGFGWRIATNAGPFLLSFGRSRLFTATVFAKTISVLGCMAAGGHLMGGEGVILGVAAGSILYYPIDAWIHRRFGLWIWRLDGLFLGLIITAVAIAILRRDAWPL